LPSTAAGVVLVPIEVTIDKGNGLITRTLTGQIAIEEIIAKLRETAAHPDYHTGMKSLNDLREFVPVSDSTNVRQIAEYLLANAAEREGLRAAIVVSRTVDYGMARMLQCWPTRLPSVSPSSMTSTRPSSASGEARG